MNITSNGVVTDGADGHANEHESKSNGKSAE
jgi:hypothetical protein